MRSRLVALVLTALASVACGAVTSLGAPEPSTLAPAPVASPTPVAPRAPTASPAPIGLNPRGPFVLFAGQNIGVWISNPDGSFPTQLAEEWLFGFDLRRAVSPQGDRLALVAQNEAGFDLVEITLPAGRRRTLAHLIDISPDELGLNLTADRSIVAMMISQYDNIAWQPPDGRLLAYAGAADGPTSDIYVVDTTTDEIRQLTDGPSQAIIPRWSPDGTYIHHLGVSLVPPFGGAIVGYNRMDGAWAVRLGDSDIISQPILPHPSAFVGWRDEASYLMVSGSQELRSVAVATGGAKALPDLCPIEAAAASGEAGAILLACSTQAGIFSWVPEESSPPVLLDPQKSWGLSWMDEGNVFFAYPIGLFTADGTTRYDPPTPDSSFDPAVSALGYQAWNVIEQRQGRVLVRQAAGEWQEILRQDVDQLLWDPMTGETLLIVTENGDLYSASAPDFSPRPLGHLGGGVDQAIWVE